MSYTNVFGGQTIFPAMLNLRQIALSANIQLEWPTETATTAQVVAYIMQVTPSAGSLEIAMPPADQTANGQSVLFTNEGASAYTVTDYGGTGILTVAAGETWDLWIVDNADEDGTWNSAQRGATTGSVNVAALAGKGIKAITTTLNQDYPVSILSMDYVAGATDRAQSFVWNSGAGLFDLPNPATVTDGWFVNLRNGGSGTLTVTPASGSINGAASLSMQPSDSCQIVTDGSNYFTIGLGVQATFAFDFVSIAIPGTGNYTLTGAELNRISYQFTGILTGNRDIIVPPTTQQYWVTNDTTGAFQLGVRTATQASPGVVVDQGESSIMYSNGTDVVDADTQGISLPVAVAQGGTGATTASGARTNLGGTAVGVAVFTAVDAAAGRTALALGSMATQDATAVAITGGTLDAVTLTNATAVQLTSTDAGAARNPTLDLYRNSATPAANDFLGYITFTGEDDGGGTQIYASVDAQIVDPVAGSEDGRLDLNTAIAGTHSTRAYVQNGIVVGSPTGADQGAGTVNATGLFVNGIAVSQADYNPQTAGYTVIAADRNGVVNFTTAGVTAALTAAATLGDGFRVTIKNTAATGDVTINPDGGETLDGAATRVLRPGDWAEIVDTGTAWLTVAGRYSSAAAAITTSTTDSFPHLMTNAPTNYGAYIIADATPELGYSAGQRVDVRCLDVNGASTRGSVLYADATNVHMTWGSASPGVLNISTFAVASIDVTKWTVALWAEY